MGRPSGTNLLVSTQTPLTMDGRFRDGWEEHLTAPGSDSAGFHGSRGLELRRCLHRSSRLLDASGTDKGIPFQGPLKLKNAHRCMQKVLECVLLSARCMSVLRPQTSILHDRSVLLSKSKDLQTSPMCSHIGFFGKQFD